MGDLGTRGADPRAVGLVGMDGGWVVGPMKIKLPEGVAEQVKRDAELAKEQARVVKAWDSVANTAFTLMATRKEANPVNHDGVERSVNQIADLLRLKLEIIRTFAALGGQYPQFEETPSPPPNGQEPPVEADA